MLYVTTGDIARVTGRDRDQISYALRRAGVKPVGRAGIVRLFSQSAVGAVEDFLKSRQRKENPYANADR